MFDFSGKTVLITGGGAGIGKAIAESFGRAGAQLVIAEIDADRVAETQESFDAAGVRAIVQIADARDRSAIEDLVRQGVEAFGGFDVLVNNVGHFMGIAKPFEQHSDDDIEALYAINLKSVFLASRAVIPTLLSGGSIISISSIEAFRGIPMTAVYSAFKHAITGFTRSLALELGPRGIRVNAIAPETTDTPQVPVHAMIAPEHRSNIPRWIPLGRFGQPDDIAGAAMFLASDYAAWVTGTTIHVDGGALAAGGWYRDPRGTWTNVPVISGNGFNF